MVCRSCTVVGLVAVACGPTVIDEEQSDSEQAASSTDPTASDGLPGDESGASGVDESGDAGADESGGAGTDESGESGGPPPVDPSDPDSPLWVRTYDGETHNRDVAVCVAVHDDDTILVGGFEVLDAFGGDSRSWIARLDGVGDVVWIVGEDRALPEAIAVTPSGRVITAGRVPSPITGWLMAVRSYGPDGEQQWSADQAGETAYDVTTIGEDAIAVGAAVDSTGWITRRDVAGEIVFNASVGPGAVAVAADADSLLVAAAEDESNTALMSISAADGNSLAEPLPLAGLAALALERDALGPVLVAFGGDGVRVGRLAGEAFAWSDVPSVEHPMQFEWDVAIDAAGNIVVAGSRHSDPQGAWLRKYSPDGAVLWTRSYVDGPQVYVNGIAIAPNQDIVAVGSIRSGGDDLWVSRWRP